MDDFAYVTHHAHEAGAFGEDSSGWVAFVYHLDMHMGTWSFKNGRL